MPSRYTVELIDVEEKDGLMERFSDRFLYEERADIYGCCIKLLTDKREVKMRWEDNFYKMSSSIRSHGRLVVLDVEGEANRVLYDPLSKTAFLFNIDYYGWIKSLALSVAGDILEDEHGIYSVHGACIDIGGLGVCLMGASGSGKTTHAYGLLRRPEVRVVADDWIFVRIFEDQVLAYGSERNFYVRADIAQVWPAFRRFMELAEVDEKGRAVINLRWVVGRGRIIPFTTLKVLLILERSGCSSKVVEELSVSEALRKLRGSGFYNPHLLVRDERKNKLRMQFFERILRLGVKPLLVDTTHPVEVVHERIVEVLRSMRRSFVL